LTGDSATTVAQGFGEVVRDAVALQRHEMEIEEVPFVVLSNLIREADAEEAHYVSNT
jgi:hypothetical protein